MATPRILLVGKEPKTVQSVNAVLAGHLYETETVEMGSHAITRLHRTPVPDLVLFELANDHGKGLQLLQEVRQIRPDVKVVVLLSIANKQQVVEAIRNGAQDYLTIPVKDRELLDLLHRHLNRVWESDASDLEILEEVGGGHSFVAGNSLMQKVRAQAELLANIDVPVLILGESGTGKEVTAHLIHKLSARSRQKFLKVNCAALPSELLESELFGYQRGAFPGATRTKVGKFELCDKGTIFLDEVAEMSAGLQAKLLHVLQEKQFFRLGGETAIEVDVRILAATNVDIQRAMAEHRFREDLYYRLSAFTIKLPPLRERRDEILVLLRYFMRRTAAEYFRMPLQFSPRLIDACLHYAWPGNLRELQNFVKRYLVMADETMALEELHTNCRRKPVAADGFSPEPQGGSFHSTATVNTNTAQSPCDLKFLVRNLKEKTEIQAITKALAETNWNRKRAARLLHISYRGLLYKIRQHGIRRAAVTPTAPYLRNGHSAT
jgi:two-component system, NtrC family, response regulator AtoC